ncbi:MAG: hypothetical protein ACXWXO_02410 [Nocardioides sp.]
MRTTATISALLVLIVLGGCGEDSPSAETAAPPRWGDCTLDDLENAGGAELAAVGDSEVTLVDQGDGPCAGGLVARSGEGVTGLDVADLDLEAGTARVVALGDTSELLLVHGGVHPRGGFQPHLFVLADGLHEVMEGGNPLLPFVATDGGAAPMTATCVGDGKIGVLTATTSEPPGVILAWDVQRTAYRLEGHEAVLVGTKLVRDHAADPMLRKEMPELFDPDASFADCLA